MYLGWLCACLEKTREGNNLSPLTDLEAARKQDIKVRAEVETAWLRVEGVSQRANQTPQQKGGDLLVPGG